MVRVRAADPEVQLTAPTQGGRLRAYLLFVAALLYYFVARSLAHHSAQGFASDLWLGLVEQLMLVFLLLVGYAVMGFWIDRQADPMSQQGLPRRPGWRSESGLGVAFGWGLAVVCVLPMTVIGGIAIYFSAQASSWGWLVVDAAFFALAALAEEIAFRGCAFQCFVRAVGPLGATLGFAAALCHRAAANARLQHSQLHRGSRLHDFAFHGLPAHARFVGELGHQLWMEGQPGPGIRTRGARRLGQFARRAGRSDGAVLADGRRLRSRRQLVHGRCFPCRSAGCLQDHARSRLSL